MVQNKGNKTWRYLGGILNERSMGETQRIREKDWISQEKEIEVDFIVEKTMIWIREEQSCSSSSKQPSLQFFLSLQISLYFFIWLHVYYDDIDVCFNNDYV